MAVRSTGRRVRPARTAVAFAPGHITGLFAPSHVGRDPRRRGSVGAGVVLDLGVTARASWADGGARSVRVRSAPPGPRPISTTVADRLLDGRRGALLVELHHDLPIGQGFGMSAAGATATALAVGAVTGVPPDRSVAVAHLADLFGGGGLGGVGAILGGGWEQRRTPGVPPYGAITHRQFDWPIVVAVAGPPVPSPARLADRRFLESVTAAGRIGLARLGRRPSAAAFLQESIQFGDTVGGGGAGLQRAVRSVRATGAFAQRTMFGNALWAVPQRGASVRRIVARLERLDLPAVVTSARPTGRGAALLEGPPSSAARLLNGTRLARLP